MLNVFVPDGEPPKTKTLKPPSDNVPSLVVKVCVVPDNCYSSYTINGSI